jgi:hypothetical protein
MIDLMIAVAGVGDFPLFFAFKWILKNHFLM